jgi:hypothetical protein
VSTGGQEPSNPGGSGGSGSSGGSSYPGGSIIPGGSTGSGSTGGTVTPGGSTGSDSSNGSNGSDSSNGSNGSTGSDTTGPSEDLGDDTTGGVTSGTTTTTTKKVPAKGKTVTQSGITYKVTKSSAKNGTVSVISVKNQTKVTIPASIKISGYTFKVTAIAGKAFYKKTKLTTVVIGKNVTKIGANSFRNCTKLKSVTFKGTTAPTIGKNAFKGTASKITVRVPKAMKSSVLKKLKTRLKSAGISKNVKYKKV